MTAKHIFFIPFFLVSISVLYSQDIPVSIENPVKVSSGDFSFPHFEPHLVVNPTNPDNLIVASMAVPQTGKGTTVRIYSSFDGGRHWSYSPLGSEPVYGGDPWLSFGADGTVYFVYLPGIVQFSIDGGKSWSPPAHLPKGEANGERNSGSYDYPKMIVDNSSNNYKGRIYVIVSQADRTSDGATVFPVAILRSMNQGKSFSFPERILPGDINYQNGQPALLADGTLLIPFQEVTKKPGVFFESPRLWLTKSEDGGKSFSTPSLLRENFLAMAPNSKADATNSQFRDRAYLTWSTGPKDNNNLFIAHSPDKGVSWTEPVQVNDGPAKSSTYPPAVAINKDGIVGLFWMDTRIDSTATCLVPYFALSKDGGETVDKNIPLSEEAICNDTPANEIAFNGNGTTVLRRWRRGGDYFGLEALPDGTFQAVWADSRTGVFQLWTARIRLE